MTYLADPFSAVQVRAGCVRPWHEGGRVDWSWVGSWDAKAATTNMTSWVLSMGCTSQRHACS